MEIVLYYILLISSNSLNDLTSLALSLYLYSRFLIEQLTHFKRYCPNPQHEPNRTFVRPNNLQLDLSELKVHVAYYILSSIS